MPILNEVHCLGADCVQQKSENDVCHQQVIYSIWNVLSVNENENFIFVL